MPVAVATRTERLRVTLHGAVQGVGFRPTVYRLATRLRLGGWVRNTLAGLEIEVEGASEAIEQFLTELKRERPRAAVVGVEEILRVAPSGASCFEILRSDESVDNARAKSAAILPDLATCEECLAEIFDPANRRHLYPFTNCTLCGPRYSILIGIPYDRPNTTMRNFELCRSCRREYESHGDRRFHAQPNACAECGPRLRVSPGSEADPIAHVAHALAEGKIVAVKGISGFHLMVDARNSAAVKRLRERKHRDHKPFAMLMPSIEYVRRYCELNTAEEELLRSQAAPIILLQPRVEHDLAPEVAQGSSVLGIMLPSSPIQHLLMRAYPFPVVATSGNRSGEPIAIHNEEALTALVDIADIFLVHDRPIERPCDDSVVRVLPSDRGNSFQILRRARGHAPLPLSVTEELRPVLAVGGHLKNTVAIAIGRQAFLSQHIGDLDSLETRDAFQRAVDDLCRLYRFEPEAIVCDLHPDYASTMWAEVRAKQLGIPLVRVQHHHAHVAACAAENRVTGDYLGVTWDGSGLGEDGSIWGGEFFHGHQDGFDRVAHLRPFALPGGETAMRDCSRPAAGLLWEMYGTGDAHFSDKNGAGALATLESGVNSPRSSSVGRLFDAIAYLSGAGEANLFEGQAAMCLEGAIGRTRTDASYEIHHREGVGDWTSLVEELLTDKRHDIELALISAKFHNALANWILAVARQSGHRKVVMSGGVFQNAYLSSRTSLLLEASGFEVFTHHLVPANDGGLALGQAVLGSRILKGVAPCV
ncbi:carbamoyltransferase HypF [Granulicella aggregans]|uniref:carbamoyltransferase HypF n=1 Tax=Granulicella aggregans TaxID=474949 RepID=UPI0021E03633|nr:carbamoyltransferase HypF [Granulicella aggregans]